MKSWLKRGVIAGTVLALVVAVGACASKDGQQGGSVAKRQALMKQNGGHMKKVGGFVKAGKGTTADVVRASQGIAASAKMIPGLFPKGTSMNDGVKTRAKPEIWQQRAKFDAAADNLAALAEKLTKAAQTGDKKAITVAMGNLGKSGCGGCHRNFRAKKK